MNEEIYHQFNAIPDPFRALCIDAAAVGCYLHQQGHEVAGRKLIRTAVLAAGLDVTLISALLDNLPQSLDSLPMHMEIKYLVKDLPR